MLRSQKFRAHCSATASQPSIGSSKIDKSRFSIPQKESGTVIREPLRKIETPLLQLIKRRARSEPAQREYRRHIQRTRKRFAQTHGPKIMTIVILRIVVGVLVANCIGGVRQKARSSQQPLIDRVEIDERLQCG